MVTRDGKQLARQSKETCQIAKPEAKHKVSPLRKRMIRDMELAGFTGGTQQTYIGAVVKLQDHYSIRPDRLSEKQVQQYIFWLRDEKDVAKGTFQTSWYGLKFFYYRTLGVDWSLFTRKKVRQPRRKRLPVARLTSGTDSGVRTANPMEQVRTLSCNTSPVTCFGSLSPITG